MLTILRINDKTQQELIKKHSALNNRSLIGILNSNIVTGVNFCYDMDEINTLNQLRNTFKLTNQKKLIKFYDFNKQFAQD